MLELYAKAKSSLISQQGQFFNKKCKKTYNFMVSLYWQCLIVSKLQSHNKETVFFLFPGVSDIRLIDQGSLSQLENPAPKPLGHSL